MVFQQICFHYYLQFQEYLDGLHIGLNFLMIQKTKLLDQDKIIKVIIQEIIYQLKKEKKKMLIFMLHQQVFQQEEMYQNNDKKYNNIVIL